MKINFKIINIKEVPLNSKNVYKGAKVILRRRGAYAPWPTIDFTIKDQLILNQQYEVISIENFAGNTVVEILNNYRYPLDHFNLIIHKKK